MPGDEVGSPTSGASGYAVADITTWPVVSQEARGLDPKDWVVAPDDLSRQSQEPWWLFKPVKEAGYRRYDDWAEKLACELAALIGLPSAHVELARRGETEGIISRNVTPDGWSLESGDTLLSEIEGYVSCAADDRPRNRTGHNLGNIARVLAGASGPPGTSVESWGAFEVFAGYLVFDAWVANTDRHAINWGVVVRDVDGSRALAASFDHGSALASGTQDERLDRAPVERFADRGRAGRFEDGARRPLVDLALEAVDRAGGRAAQWQQRLAVLPSSDVVGAVNRIVGMSEVRRRFLCTLLETTRGRLTA